MPRERLTPRERWQAVLERKRPDRVPMDYWGTDEATARLVKHLGCHSRQQALEKLHVDFVVKAVPDYTGPLVAQDFDIFGCGFRNIDYGTGVYRECVFSSLAGFETLAQVQESYRWPSPDWWDYKTLPRKLQGQDRYPIQGGDCEPFLAYKNLRGEAQAFIDLIEHPDIASYCLGRLFDLFIEQAVRIYEVLPGRVLLTYVAEDMGGQTDLLISPDHIRRFLLPGMKRMIDLAHQAGAFVFHHNDGGIRRILPEIIDLGIDILNPVQWRTPGMDREGLKRDFGRRVIFHGAMDNQQTLPFGTVEDVQREVEDNLRILGEGGGYILAPCHNVQAVTPVENIVAMYETGYALGWIGD